jgi:hypothetical protein
MKKLKKRNGKKWRKLKKKGRRNAAPVAVAAPRRRSRIRRGMAPDWKTTLAAVAGGAGGAALGGLVVNQQILSPEAVGLGMIGLGGATAYFADGNTRVLGNSVAAAGAGQLALAIMARRAIAGGDRPATPPKSGEPPPPQLAAPTTPADTGPPRRKSPNGGVVLNSFREVQADLSELEDDELDGGPRDSAGLDEDLIYDLEDDEAA